MYNKCKTGAAGVVDVMKKFKGKPKIKELFGDKGSDWLLSQKFETFFERPIEEWRDIMCS